MRRSPHATWSGSIPISARRCGNSETDAPSTWLKVFRPVQGNGSGPVLAEELPLPADRLLTGSLCLISEVFSHARFHFSPHQRIRLRRSRHCPPRLRANLGRNLPVMGNEQRAHAGGRARQHVHVGVTDKQRLVARHTQLAQRLFQAARMRLVRGQVVTAHPRVEFRRNAVFLQNYTGGFTLPARPKRN